MAEYFFGYGSLVNRQTHDYPDARRARLEGWRRTWCLTPLRPEVFLTARPVEGTAIDGLVAAVPHRDWAMLDLRETGYRRHPVTSAVSHDLGGGADVQVYSIPQEDEPSGGGHILLSYLDVVVQGYLHHYGEEGAAAFFATTDGWARDIIDDREAPRYSRHQHLSDAERALVDAHLAEKPARRRSLDDLGHPQPAPTVAP